MKQEFRKGIILDCSRTYLPKDTIIKVIDSLAENRGAYLQMHFSDNEGYRIYSEFLGNTGNTPNNKEYLTKQEIEEIVNHANNRNIIIYPDFDVPAHSKGWLELYKKKYGEQAYLKVVSDFDDSLVDFFGNDNAVEVIGELVKEISKLFRQPKFFNKQYFSMGTDEVPGVNNFQKDFVMFVNKVSNYVRESGYKVRLWNDSYNSEGLKLLNNKNTEIVFWLKGFLNAIEFSKQGFFICNSNFWSYVYSPKAGTNIENQAQYVRNNHNPYKFCHGDSAPYTFEDIDSNLLNSTSYTFWNENGEALTREEMDNQLTILTKNYLQLPYFKTN